MRTTTKKRTTYQKRADRKHLANPTVDVAIMIILVVLLVITPHLTTLTVFSGAN